MTLWKQERTSILHRLLELGVKCVDVLDFFNAHCLHACRRPGCRCNVAESCTVLLLYFLKKGESYLTLHLKMQVQTG